MAHRTHPLSAPAADALTALGAQIAAGRRDRRWTAEELAGRAGIATKTLRNVERGAPISSIGVVFELATLVGVPLYSPTNEGVRDARSRATERLALLPQRVKAKATEVVDDDF
tara:strand:+ start:4491 stop:4829 length:339 start_codon:yes stop_codon:yes gene_type:complete